MDPLFDPTSICKQILTQGCYISVNRWINQVLEQ